MWMFWAFFCLAAAPVLCVPPAGLQPEQVHVSYTGQCSNWRRVHETDSVYRSVCSLHDKPWKPRERIDNARIGDEFMRQIQSIAAYVPYMTSPGNHENAYNFSNYRNRFSMPGDTESLWYSWNIGPAHIISFSTEVYFYLEYGLDLIFKQYSWLEKDLEEANKPENRRVRPWIITMAHRPMYCSNDDKDDCTKFESYVRVGRNDTMPVAPGLEKLFYDYGVDLELWAHEHTYERLWPVYGFQVFNGSMEHPYVNPRAPVHIITGSAGCREKHDGFIPAPRDWSAFRSTDYGYTRMQILNSTHLYLEQVSDDQNGRVIDNMWLVKEQHSTAAWK
ncbi:UNVERIFIED_CONTAM: hypothetical protein FKN15_073065 [Acipenser sinensis]